MKILFFGLDKNILVAGSAVQKRFISYGNLVERIYILAPGTENREFHISENVHVKSFKTRNKFESLLKLFFLGFFALKKEKYSLLSTRDTYYAGFVAVLLRKLTNTPLEIQVHGFEKYNGLRKCLAHFVIKRATGIRTVSNRLKKMIEKEFEVAGEKIGVVPIFIDSKRFTFKCRKENGSDFTFITLSRLVKVKRFKIQLEAIKTLAEEFPNIRLLIGGSGVEENSLKKYAEDLGISKKVSFQGFVEDSAEFLQKGDAFLLSSLSEGYGLAPLEAALSGLPVIMTDVGIANEILVHNENALVVDVNDKKGFVDAMRSIMCKSELREKFCTVNKDLSKKILGEEETMQTYKDNWIKIAHEKFI